MATHPLPTVRGLNRHFTTHGFQWQTLFNELDSPDRTSSLRDIALKYKVPPSTLSVHYKDYKAVLATSDEVRLAVAQGVIDGRRDNHRIFSRAEKVKLVDELHKENVHPNLPLFDSWPSASTTISWRETVPPRLPDRSYHPSLRFRPLHVRRMHQTHIPLQRSQTEAAEAPQEGPKSHRRREGRTGRRLSREGRTGREERWRTSDHQCRRDLC